MGTIVTYNQPCLNPECGSSDARQIYDDGSSFCFSCGTRFNSRGEHLVTQKIEHKSKISVEDIKNYPVRGFKERGITKTVCEFFSVKVSYGEDGEIDTHYYPYDDNTVYKIRKLPKEFSSTGHFNGLFGQDKFSAGGKRLIICEGEIDALSIAQASQEKYKKIYPVIALAGSSFANKSLLKNRDWIRSFQEVVICFDEDEAGYKAQKEAINIIGLDKVKITKLPEKDANDTLKKFGGQVLLDCVFNAAQHIPAGIIEKEALWEALVEYNNTPSVLYPDCIGGINTKTKGARLGEIALFVSGTS